MRTKVFLLVLMCMISGMIYAQDGQGQRQPRDGQRREQGQRKTTEERAKEQSEQMKKDFQLTDVQYDSVQKINLRYAKKAEAAFQENQGAGREAFQKNQEEKNKELKKILTEEQYKKYDEQLKARRRRN